VLLHIRFFFLYLGLLKKTNDMKKLTKQQLTEKILSSAGKFFRVTFLKKDGSVRDLNGRIGVVSRLKGGATLVDKDKFLVVYDMVNQGYRSVNKDTIQEVAFGGEVYQLGDN